MRYAEVVGNVRTALLVIAAWIISDLSSAQHMIAEYSSNRGAAGTNDSFGSEVAPLGDLDGDGVVDFLVAAQDEDNDVYPWQEQSFGAIRVFSGATGAILRKHLGPEKAGRLGMQIEGGSDFDGDGVPDYILASPELPNPSVTGEGIAYVHSGATGALLFTWLGERYFDSFGACVRILGDVDADGVDDIGIGAPEYDAGPTKGQAGRAYVYSGRTGTVIYTYTGSQHDQWLGTVYPVGDIDFDGHADFFVGSYGWNAPPNAEGRADIYSGASGALLYSLIGEHSGDAFGGFACPLGDVNGDGAPDFAVGSYQYDVVDSEGRMYVYSGPTGALLYTIDGIHKDEHLGILPVMDRIDFNRDGYDDLVIGTAYPTSSSTWQSALLVHSGINGRLLYRRRGIDYKGGSTETFGAAIAAIGDLNQDGFEDLLVGAPAYASTYYASEGRAYVVGGDDLLLSIEPLVARVGDTVVADLRSGPPGLLGLLVMVDMAGTPAFTPLHLAPFNSFGEMQLSAGVPSAASGLDFTFQGFSQNRNGRGPLMDSGRVTVTVK